MTPRTPLNQIAHEFPPAEFTPPQAHTLHHCLGALRLLQHESLTDPEAAHILADRVLLQAVRILAEAGDLETQNMAHDITLAFLRTSRHY